MIKPKYYNWMIMPLNDSSVTTKQWSAADTYSNYQLHKRTWWAAYRWTQKAFREHGHKFIIVTVKTKMVKGHRSHCRYWNGW